MVLTDKASKFRWGSGARTLTAPLIIGNASVRCFEILESQLPRSRSASADYSDSSFRNTV